MHRNTVLAISSLVLLGLESKTKHCILHHDVILLTLSPISQVQGPRRDNYGPVSNIVHGKQGSNHPKHFGMESYLFHTDSLQHTTIMI